MKIIKAFTDIKNLEKLRLQIKKLELKKSTRSVEELERLPWKSKILHR